MSREQPRSWGYTCPYCGAEPGTTCRSKSGHIQSWEHLSRRLLTALTERRLDSCRNCAQTIVQHAGSPTGFVHIESGRTRCDGRALSGLSAGASKTSKFPMAVPA